MSTPAPGVYPDTPMDDYLGWDAASNSRLSRLMRSPAHLRAYLDEPGAATPALRLGRAAHSAVLEPDLFTGQYVRGIEGDRRTKAVKEEWAALEAAYPGAEILSPKDYDTVAAMRDRVWEHPAASALLSGEGDAELSMTWEDPGTGVLCKARWDRHSPEIDGGAIVDYKTCQDASPPAFERAIFNFGYFRQGAFYLRGARARKLPIRHFVIVAQEKAPPYAVAVYRLSAPTLDGGNELIDTLLARYAECIRSDEWPGYPEHVTEIAVPAWAWDRIDEQKSLIEEAA